MRRSLSASVVARMAVAIAFGASLALIAVAVASGASARASVRAAQAAGCGQPPQSYWVFNSYNQCGALNGAKPALVRLAKPAHITQLADYHFNLGVAVKPGTIGLLAPNGYMFGPYRATQQAGTWDWVTIPINLTVPAGTYSVIDSNTATWSQNAFSGGRGFTRIFGGFVASAPPLPAPKPTPKPPSPAPAHPTCASNPPSSFLISPDHVAGGGLVSFLLSCQKAASLGFQGAFAPLKVEIYDEASYRNLRFVSGYLQPISPSFPVRPPLVIAFKVAGPNDVGVTLPAGMQRGVYVVVIVYAKGEVPSANLLNVP
jgi:hypothetical protein